MIRALIAGCGGMADHWLTLLAERSDVEVVALVDPVPGRAAKMAAAHGLQQVFTAESLSDGLNRTGPDVVFDLSIPAAHCAVAVAAMEAGCHVLGEKPLAASPEEARRILETSRRTGRVHAVMQNRRFDSGARRLARLLREGKIGALRELHADFFTGPRFEGFRRGMQHVLLLDMAVHHFDAARLISGRNAVTALCHEWNPADSFYTHGASATAIFEMSGGTVFTYRGSWSTDGLNTTWECDWRATATKGSAQWDGAEDLKAERVTNVGKFGAECEALPSPYLREHEATGGHAGCIDEFLRALREERLPETHAEDNFHSLAMVFAAIESARTGRRVAVATPEDVPA